MDVELYPFVSKASLWLPERLLPGSPAPGYVPLASWLVEVLRPAMIVEVGPGPATLSLAFCQAAERLGLATGCQVVFTDGHSGHTSPTPDETLQRLGQHSIDLLHVAGSQCCGAIEGALPEWIGRISRSGLIVVSGTWLEAVNATRRLFDRLSREYPNFEFHHDGGLGIVAVGAEVPEALARLVEASRDPQLAGQIRHWYERLGLGVRDRLERTQLAHIVGSREARRATSGREHQSVGSLLEQNTALLEENWLAGQDRLLLTEEIAGLHELNRGLRERLRQFERGYHELDKELYGLKQSLAWALLQRARRMRRLLIREGHASERYWNSFIGIVRSAVRSGPRKTAGKIALKMRQALGLPGRTPAPVIDSPLAHLVEVSRGDLRWRDLGWVYTGEPRARIPGKGPYHTVLLISHSACRTGAPSCLLRLARELSTSPLFDCWIVLQRGGELFDEFTRVAPTLDVGRLAGRGIRGEELPGLLASLLRVHASRAFAVCNTMAVNEFHAALAECGIPVVSWVHELPTMVGIFGGAAAIERVRAASRQIIVPAEVVRDAWIRRFRIEPETIVALRYGVEPRSDALDRRQARARVCREFGIPDDGLIVLGCGTVDLRKGADLFARLARALFTHPGARDVANRTWLLWVGDAPFPFLEEWLTHDADVEGFEGQLVFSGEREDTAPFFAAADVFVLTSREDPCPFANLEAMESGLPAVVFQDAGGAPEVIGAAGISVPYLDLDAMLESVVDLLRDPSRRAEMGAAGRAIIRRDFTWRGFMERFHGLLHRSCGVFPPVPLRVSVIVPNYRHAPYLEDRLGSIFRQTIAPHEIIVLDDASPDDSIAVIERLMPSSPVPIRLLVNEANSGSTFRQWIKGIEIASGDVIWLAESDDSCHPEFLERLLPEFFDPEVALVYCQSELIGPDGSRLEAHFLAHTDDLSRSRWRARYCVPGLEEVEQALSQKNTIPNASALLFRRPPRLDFLDELFGLRFAGDWLFHAMLCRDGKVAYLPDVLNRYRRHEQTVSHRAIRADTYLSETLRVKRRTFETFEVSAQAMTRSLAQTVFEYHLLNPDANSRSVSESGLPSVREDLSAIRELLDNRQATRSSLRILLIFDGLSSSLLTLSDIHLANALARDHIVFLCNTRPELCDREVLDQLDSRVLPIEGAAGVPEWQLAKQHRGDWDRSEVRIKVLEELIRLHAIDVIDSRSEAAEAWAQRVAGDLELPWFAQSQLLGEGDVRGREPREKGPDVDAPKPGGTPSRVPGDPGLDPGFLQQEANPRGRRDDSFVVCLLEGEPARSRLARAAATAVKAINRLPMAERGGRWVRLLAGETGDTGLREPTRDSRSPGDREETHVRSSLQRLAGSDVVLMREPRTRLEHCHLSAALGMGIPVLLVAGGRPGNRLRDGSQDAGQLLSCIGGNADRVDLDQLLEAILRYLREPGLHRAHRSGAEAVFLARHASDRFAERVALAYHEACNSLTRHHVQSPVRNLPGGLHQDVRQSA
jgi:glycosyltransferase involved in cell wall biosynthesis